MNFYHKLLKHPKWFAKRKIVLMRDGGKCANCGSAEKIQVHHRQYHINKNTGRFKMPWEYKLKCLVTLCEKCHIKGHTIFKVPIFKI